MREVSCISYDFGSSPAPAVRASFYIPRINYECPTTFVIDTGSDSTCLHGQVAYKLQKKMITGNLTKCCGVGGLQEYFREEKAIIIFRDLDLTPFETIHPITLLIQCILAEDAKDGDILSLPSILGRDILNEGQFIYNKPDAKVSLSFPDTNTKLATIKPS